VFSGSIGVENLEMAGLVQRFKAAYGSPNFFSVESVCYRMRIRVRQMTFGRYPVEEMDSNLYILWGHNPDQSDFPLKFSLKKNLDKGAKLVVIDPKRIPIADRADMYLRIRPGTDGALALAMMNVIITESLYDKEFIEQHTFGFERLVPHVQKYTPEWPRRLHGCRRRTSASWPGFLQTPRAQAFSKAPALMTRQPTALKTAVPSPSFRRSPGTST